MNGYAQIKVADGTWARSEFPHPLVTLDFDADGKLLCVSAVAQSAQFFPDGDEETGA